MNHMDELPKGKAHLVTIGTTPPGMTDDVVEALIADLASSRPSRVVVLATADSEENARRLFRGIKIAKSKTHVRLLESAQSLDEAYLAANEEIAALFSSGVDAHDMILHYTAGTKVMSAGAVLAALNNDVDCMRYLYSVGRGRPSVPITTPTRSVLCDKQMRLAMRLLYELRFRSGGEVLAGLDQSFLSESQRTEWSVLGELSHAYEDWDSFRVGEFLRRYRAIEKQLAELPSLADFQLKKSQLRSLEKIVAAETADGIYPDELLIDLFNNAIRRLVEGRPDDALIRLHRAAELYAQGVLMAEFGIRTDDVDIRKVPPRSRTSFEAERRLDDAKIKIGLRKSYELLEVLDNPIGHAYRERETFRDILGERRNLVLAHGTRPATMPLAMAFLREVEDMFRHRITDLRRRAAAAQFPWINNKDILEQLEKRPVPERWPLNTAAGKKRRRRRKSSRSRDSA